MSLISHALAFGLGYVLGTPEGRERARQVPGQLREIAARPEAERVREKGKELAGQAAQAAKQRLTRSTASSGAESGTGTGGAPAGTGPDLGQASPGPVAWRRRLLFVRLRRRPGGTTDPVLAPTSGDPATDVRSAELADAPVVETPAEAATRGTLPPGRPSATG